MLRPLRRYPNTRKLRRLEIHDYLRIIYIDLHITRGEYDEETQYPEICHGHQGCIFAYSDTQRYRFGPNYLLLPSNAPKCPHHNNHIDGAMNFLHRDEWPVPMLEQQLV